MSIERYNVLKSKIILWWFKILNLFWSAWIRIRNTGTVLHKAYALSLCVLYTVNSVQYCLSLLYFTHFLMLYCVLDPEYGPDLWILCNFEPYPYQVPVGTESCFHKMKRIDWYQLSLLQIITDRYGTLLFFWNSDPFQKRDGPVIQPKYERLDRNRDPY